MAKQSDLITDKEIHAESINEEVSAGKKPFIEPELSDAVDVLEATTFFQATSSGVTN